MAQLTDEDKLILETIREQNFKGKSCITIAQWKTVLNSSSTEYIKEILRIHEELNTIQIIGRNHYRLTMHGVLLLDGMYSRLFALFKTIPYVE